MTERIERPNLVLGEVLFDIFPNERFLGGAPFNFAFHLHCLGAPVAFFSRVGEYPLGREILDYLREYKFSIEGIQTDAKYSTGEVRVSLNATGKPKFEILDDRAYDYLQLNPYLRSMFDDPPPLVYFGTLAQRNPVSRKTIQETLRILSENSNLFLDLNLRAPFYDINVIQSSLKFCDVLKVSEEELQEIGKILEVQGNRDSKNLIMHLQNNYKIKWICVTKGENGSELYKDGTADPLFQSAHTPRLVIDTVGAGDAFSAMLALGLSRQWPEPLILERASLFASEICSIKGALPKSRSIYIPFGIQNG